MLRRGFAVSRPSKSFARGSDEATAPVAGHRACCRSRCWRSRRLSLASAGLTGVAGVRAPARAGRGRHWAGRDVLPYPVVALGRHFGGVRAAGPGRVARRDTAAGGAGGWGATAGGGEKEDTRKGNR